MPWETDAVIIIRNMINDIDSSNYTDDRIKELFLVSSYFVQMDIGFSTGFVVDLSLLTIDPDPTSIGDSSFLNLTCLWAAHQFSLNEAKLAAGQSIDIRDGTSMVGLRGLGKAKTDIALRYYNLYNDMKRQYMCGVRCVGEVIVTAFRTYETIR